MKIIATTKAEQNRAAVDPWTIIHFSAGLASGLVNAPLRVTFPLAVLYEIFERRLEAVDVGQEIFDTSGPERLPNALVDLGVFLLGHGLGRRWNDTR